jgi:hypothetical protein
MVKQTWRSFDFEKNITDNSDPASIWSRGSHGHNPQTSLNKAPRGSLKLHKHGPSLMIIVHMMAGSSRKGNKKNILTY